jgi:hypothetical protein
MHIQADRDRPQQAFSLLLGLTETKLGLDILGKVLQLLDRRSRASIAATCLEGLAAVLANTSQITSRHSTQKAFTEFMDLLALHSTSLPKISGFSVVSGIDTKLCLRGLPLPELGQLRELRLVGLKVQLGPAGRGKPGVLHYCAGLTALDLQDCSVVRMPAATALSQLQQLSLAANRDAQQRTVVWQLFPQLQLPLQLTHLCLDCLYFTPEDTARLSQLSGLVNLKHLELTSLRGGGVPGGVLSQLSKLTCLGISFAGIADAHEVQLQQLGSLTALEQLAVTSTHRPGANWPALQHLTQLTQLQLDVDHLNLSTSTWTQLTSLQSLACKALILEPQHLSRFTQLRVLSVECPGGQHLGVDRCLAAISRMPLLTDLQFEEKPSVYVPQAATAAAFTALTTSSNLCSLRVGLRSSDASDGCIIFQPGTVRQQLRVVDLLFMYRTQLSDSTLCIDDQQVKQLCRCCPAVESLAFRLSYSPPQNPARTAGLPLLQLPGLTQLRSLTALTSLQVQVVAPTETAAAAAAAAAVVDIAVQLTGLKRLQLRLPYVSDTYVLSLTALTALEFIKLEIRHADNQGQDELVLENKVRLVCLALATTR